MHSRSRWRELPLRVVTERLAGGTPSRRELSYWGTPGIPWFTVADLSGEKVINSLQHAPEAITELGLKNSSARLVSPGSVIFSTRVVVGKVGIAEVPLSTNQDFISFSPVHGLVSRFLAYFLIRSRDKIRAHQKGATIKGVGVDVIINLDIPIPTESEQTRIAEILDEADRLRQLRREADIKAGQALAAMFHELFEESLAYETRTLADLLKRENGALQSGPFGTHLHNSDFVDEGKILVVGIDNVKDSGFELGRRRRITEDKYSELRKYTLEPGDVLITVMGSIGRTCVFPEWASPAICSKHVYRIRVDRRRIHPEYLCDTLRFSSEVRAQLGASITGQMVAGITSKSLKELRIQLPPYYLQKEYAEKKLELGQIAGYRGRTGTLIDNLFDQLLHRAFTGDLTASWREAHMTELLQEMELQAKVLASLEAKR